MAEEEIEEETGRRRRRKKEDKEEGKGKWRRAIDVVATFNINNTCNVMARWDPDFPGGRNGHVLPFKYGGRVERVYLTYDVML